MKSLQDVYVHGLKDMYSAEKQLTEALPKMAKGAHSSDLQSAFRHHLQQTQGHMEAVQGILQALDENPGSTKCKGMEGLITEGSDILKEKGDAAALDAALISAAQKVEHYEIASYGALHTYAQTLGYEDQAATLQSILDQEYDADQKLDNLAMGLKHNTSINVKAQR